MELKNTEKQVIMIKTKYRKLSILSIVLVCVSAITAAIVPNRKIDKMSNVDDNKNGFTATESFDAGGRAFTLTCAITNAPDAGNACDVDDDSGTTDAFPVSSDFPGVDTTLL